MKCRRMLGEPGLHSGRLGEHLQLHVFSQRLDAAGPDLVRRAPPDADSVPHGHTLTDLRRRGNHLSDREN